MMNFSRYSRNLAVLNFTEVMQEKLCASSVLVVGAGGLGSAVIGYLAAAGVGHIGIVEYDLVSESNLQRQLLYSESDVGQYKGELAAKKVKGLNQLCDCRVYNAKLTEENGIIIANKYSVIVDCTDNYAARYSIDSICRKLNIPFVYGSAEQMTGQVSTFNYKGGGSYSELYPEPPASKEEVIGVLSPMPGIIGSIQALETLKIILDMEDNLSGRLLLFDGKSYQTTIFDITTLYSH